MLDTGNADALEVIVHIAGDQLDHAAEVVNRVVDRGSRQEDNRLRAAGIDLQALPEAMIAGGLVIVRALAALITEIMGFIDDDDVCITNRSLILP